MKFSLVLLTLNEIKGCELVVPKIDKSLFFEILCIDGGSTDGTIEYLRAHGIKVIVQNKNYDHVKFAKKQRKICDAYLMGVKEAKGDYVVMPFTPDNNMLPEKLPELINKAKEGYEYVCVSRYKDNAKSFDDTLVSGFGNWMFTTAVNILFKGKFTDVLGGYKCIKRDLFNRLELDNPKNFRVSIHTQLAIGCLRNNLPYADIAGDEPPRVGGESSVSVIINGFSEVITILEAFFNRSKYKIKNFKTP